MPTNVSKLDNVAAIILAGGKGTRMGVPNKHKSIFEIQGIPAILRLIGNLRAVGIDQIVVVTGVWSEQIMNTISTKYSDVAFVYQPFQSGTGNAAKYGIYYLKKIHFQGHILICMGDAFIEPQADQDLYQHTNKNHKHGALLVKLQELSPFSGHILTNNEGLAMELVPGSYACSIPEIDFIVDFLKTQEGVCGAQISGARMGGCVITIAKHKYTKEIISTLEAHYEAKWGIHPEIIITQPIHEASVFLDIQD